MKVGTLARLVGVLAALGGPAAGVARAQAASGEGGGCPRAGVAGPWQGDGSVDLVYLPFHVGFHFTDEFTETSQELDGNMQFASLGLLDVFDAVALPPFIRSAVAEQYAVTFASDDTIGFRSNWGAGGGTWGTTRYALTVRDPTGVFRVEERGVIADCSAMVVHGDFYEFGVLIGHMTATYSRPPG